MFAAGNMTGDVLLVQDQYYSHMTLKLFLHDQHFNLDKLSFLFAELHLNTTSAGLTMFSPWLVIANSLSI